MAIPGLNFWKWLSLLKPLEGFSGALPSLCYVILTRFAYQRLDSMSLDRWANTPPPPLKTWDLSLLKRLK